MDWFCFFFELTKAKFCALVNCNVLLYNVEHYVSGLSNDCVHYLSEQGNSYSNTRCLGHEKQAVPYRNRDQSVGHCLLCSTEAMHRTFTKVSTFWC